MVKNKQFHVAQMQVLWNSTKIKRRTPELQVKQGPHTNPGHKYLNNQIYYSPPQKEAETQSKPKYQPYTKWDAQINWQPE